MDTWKETLEACKVHYDAVVLWDSGAWRLTEGGPWVDSDWSIQEFQEIWKVTQEVLLKDNDMAKAKINASISLENPVVEPNGAFCPMIMFATGIAGGGKLLTSCNIQLTAGKMVVVDTEETWVSTGQVENLYIPDIDNLEADLAPTLGDPFAQAYADVLTMVDAINTLRKVI